jgi:hypothetical protein
LIRMGYFSGTVHYQRFQLCPNTLPIIIIG